MATPKTILITGANEGLGFEAARQLAMLDHHIILMCRHQGKAEAAKRRIIRESQNENITIIIANLAQHQQIRIASEKIIEKFSHIDVLINNAGGVFSNFEKSLDGLEMTIAVNHFSQFLLTYYLQDLLKASKHARVINVSSDSHYSGGVDFESFTSKKDYNILKAYSQSKLCNVLFTNYLANMWQPFGITVNALNPGRVKTKIGIKARKPIHQLGWKLLTFFSSSSIKKGTATHIMLAIDDNLNNVSGKYFSKTKQKTASKLSQDENLSAALWKFSENFAGITFTA